jgi:hypothetical protein
MSQPYTMTQFIDALASYSTEPLMFDLGHQHYIPSGYHVTEFKVVSYHTVDCGGVEHQFAEAEIELWNTKLEPNHKMMAVAKLFSIYAQIAPKLTFPIDAPLVITYAPPGMPAARYHVGAITSQSDRVVVQLMPAGVRCKAIERRAEAILPTGCCSPSQNAASAKLCC